MERFIVIPDEEETVDYVNLSKGLAEYKYSSGHTVKVEDTGNEYVVRAHNSSGNLIDEFQLDYSMLSVLNMMYKVGYFGDTPEVYQLVDLIEKGGKK